MRAMKDSGIEWIGQIPQEWGVCKIKNCFNVFAGATPKSGNSEFWDGDIVWVTPADYTTEQKYISKGRKNITREGFESCSTEMIPAGSLIFSKRAPIGLTAINTVELCTNQGCLSCVPLDENDVEYFYYAFGCFSEQFDLYGSGTTFKEISADAFVNFSIPCPVPETQRKISEYLRNRCAEIDALIAAKEKTNALLKERRQSIIYEAVTKGLNSDVPMKDSGIEWIGEIPESWAVGKLGYFIEVFNGDRSSNYPSGSDIQESGVPFLTSSNLEYDVLDMSSSKYISEEKYESMSGLKMELNDIIYCLRGSVGKCSINKTETCGTVASSLMGIRCKKMEPEFLLFVLKSPVIETQNALFMNGTCAANLSAENVCGYLVPIPAKAEQTAIAEYLQDRCTEMDELISANEATIQKLKEYRQSIIYEAVTGKIEI